MAENKMEQVDFWIRFFKEHINTIGCVELDGLDCREVLALLQELADKKVDKQNKMEAVAQLFGKKLNERFTVRYDNHLFDCKFTNCGFTSYSAYDNPYLDFDAFILQDLLVCRAVIVDE